MWRMFAICCRLYQAIKRTCSLNFLARYSIVRTFNDLAGSGCRVTESDLRVGRLTLVAKKSYFLKWNLAVIPSQHPGVPHQTMHRTSAALSRPMKSPRTAVSAVLGHAAECCGMQSYRTAINCQRNKWGHRTKHFRCRFIIRGSPRNRIP